MSLDSFLKSFGTFNQRKTIARVSIFDVPIHIIRNYCDPSNVTNTTSMPSSSDSKDPISIKPDESYDGLRCHRCGMTFLSYDDQREHFKSDTHLDNLRKSLQGSTISSSSETAQDSNDSGESSGSDDEPDAEFDKAISQTELSTDLGKIKWVYNAKSGTQWIFHPNVDSNSSTPSTTRWAISMSTVLLPREFYTNPSPWNELFTSISRASQENIWAIFLFKSGKFSGAIYSGKTCIIHKVFKRYTIRAKAGGSQSSHDNKNGKAKSAGAMMRRQGEQALKEDIQALLRSWSDYLKDCSLILISIPKPRRGIFFEDDSDHRTRSEGSLLHKDDNRIRSIPFPVDNPTFESVQKIHAVCSSISFLSVLDLDPADDSMKESMTDVDIMAIPQSDQTTTLEPIKEMEEVIDELKEKAITSKDVGISASLIDCCRSGDLSSLESILTSISEDHSALAIDGVSNILDVDYIVNIPEDDESWITPLHIASAEGQLDIVLMLLRYGADPCKRDIRGRVPHNIAKDKETRDAFRRYRGEVESQNADDNDAEATIRKLKGWDWDAAGIGAAITDEKERLKREKEKEKKKRAKQKKKEEKIRDDQEMKVLHEEIQKKEQEARKLAGECEICHVSLYDNTVYNVYDRKACSSKCVLVLRRKIAAEAAEKRFG